MLPALCCGFRSHHHCDAIYLFLILLPRCILHIVRERYYLLATVLWRSRGLIPQFPHCYICNSAFFSNINSKTKDSVTAYVYEHIFGCDTLTHNTLLRLVPSSTSRLPHHPSPHSSKHHHPHTCSIRASPSLIQSPQINTRKLAARPTMPRCTIQGAQQFVYSNKQNPEKKTPGPLHGMHDVVSPFALETKKNR
jgi:hypothetical protein